MLMIRFVRLLILMPILLVTSCSSIRFPSTSPEDIFSGLASNEAAFVLENESSLRRLVDEAIKVLTDNNSDVKIKIGAAVLLFQTRVISYPVLLKHIHRRFLQKEELIEWSRYVSFLYHSHLWQYYEFDPSHFIMRPLLSMDETSFPASLLIMKGYIGGGMDLPYPYETELLCSLFDKILSNEASTYEEKLFARIGLGVMKKQFDGEELAEALMSDYPLLQQMAYSQIISFNSGFVSIKNIKEIVNVVERKLSSILTEKEKFKYLRVLNLLGKISDRELDRIIEKEKLIGKLKEASTNNERTSILERLSDRGIIPIEMLEEVFVPLLKESDERILLRALRLLTHESINFNLYEQYKLVSALIELLGSKNADVRKLSAEALLWLVPTPANCPPGEFCLEPYYLCPEWWETASESEREKLLEEIKDLFNSSVKENK